MKKALLDTDTLINFFRKETDTLSKAQIYLSTHANFPTRKVACFEILKVMKYLDSTKQKLTFEFSLLKIQFFNVFGETIITSAKIYAVLRNHRNADLLITRIANHYHLQLLKNNLAHLKKIRGLSIVNLK